MSALRGKPDMTRRRGMSANDPIRTSRADGRHDLNLEELRNSLEELDDGLMVDLALDDDWLDNFGR